jgi:hypothetical protein
MPADTADTPVARLLAAARSLPPASHKSMARPHQDESTAVSTPSHHGTRTAVLSSTSSQGSGPVLAVIVAGLLLVVAPRSGRAPPASAGTRMQSYEPLASPG